jgi:hypothetical protein
LLSRRLLLGAALAAAFPARAEARPAKLIQQLGIKADGTG